MVNKIENKNKYNFHINDLLNKNKNINKINKNHNYL